MRFLPSRAELEAHRSTWIPATLGTAAAAAITATFAPWPDRPGIGGFRLFLFLMPICLIAASLSAGLEMVRPLRVKSERGVARTVHVLLWVPIIIIALISTYETLAPGGQGLTIDAELEETLAFLSFLLWPQYVGIPAASGIIVAHRGVRRDWRRWLLVLIGGVLVWFFWGNIFTQGDADRFSAVPLFVVAGASLALPYYRLLRPAKKRLPPAVAPTPPAPEAAPTFTSALSRPPVR